MRARRGELSGSGGSAAEAMVVGRGLGKLVGCRIRMRPSEAFDSFSAASESFFEEVDCPVRVRRVSDPN